MSRVLRGGGRGAGWSGRWGDRDRRRHRAVAAAAGIDGDRGHHATRQNRRGGGRGAAGRRSDRDRRCGKIARATAAHGDGIDRSAQNRGRTTGAAAIKQVRRAALDLVLGMRQRCQQKATESGEKDEKSGIHSVQKMRNETRQRSWGK